DAGAPAEYLHWKTTNVTPQKQAGYYGVAVKVQAGDISSTEFGAIAELSRKYGNGQVRLSFEQNFVFRWVPSDKLLPLWEELGALNLAEAGVSEITDVTSCPGTDSCKMGITSSMGAGRAIRDTVM